MFKCRFLPIYIITILSLVVANSARAQDTTGRLTWAGHALRFDVGTTINLKSFRSKCQNYPTSCGAQSYLEPYFEFGYEYAFAFKEQFYLSGGLSWIVVYPRNFQPYTTFWEPPAALWYTPMTYLQAGYIFSNDVLVTLGLVYFWALMATARFPLTEHLFFETKYVLWLDRLIGTGGAFGEGFDNAHASVGIGYHF